MMLVTILQIEKPESQFPVQLSNNQATELNVFVVVIIN